MRLQFSKVEIENFKCFDGEPQALGFDCRAIGLHFVRGINEVRPALGSNGAGKTSLWDAMCWCLYGRTPDGLRNPDVRPWSGARTTRVSLDLSCDDRPFVVVRTARPNSLTVNDEDVGQEHIDDVVMSYNTFVNTILLGQERPLFFDLKPQDKMQLFIDVLELDRWEVRSRIASEEVKRLTQRGVDIQVDLTTAQSLVDAYEENSRSLRRQVREWEEERQGRLDTVEDEIRELGPKVKKLRTDLDTASVEYDGAEVELRLVRADLAKYVGKLQKKERERQGRVVEAEQAKLEMGRLERELEDLSEARVCPMCGHKVRASGFKTHCLELVKRIGNLKKKAVVSVPKKERMATKKLESRIDRLTESEGKFDDKSSAAQERVNYLTPEHAEASARLQEVKRTLEGWADQENPYRTQLRVFRKRFDKQRELTVELKKSLLVVNRRVERSGFWISGFKECRLYALEEVLSELSLVSNMVCPELGLDGWEVIYSVEKETKSGSVQRGLNVEIRSPENSARVKWEAFSGGERQRLRLIGALALSETLLSYAGVEPDLEILDEPSRGLSPEGIGDLCECLPARANRLQRRIFYTDHQAVESSLFSSVITVRRSRDGVFTEG